MFIDGGLVDAASGATFENVNPATEEVIGHTADGGPEDRERAIAGARHRGGAARLRRERMVDPP
jgi:aldehyde dehydrogenase (NAD+)